MSKFHELLLAFAKAGSAREHKEIEAELWDDFGIEQAVFVLDMSGFSLLTRKFGVVHYLSMVRRMQAVAQPLIEQHDGRLVNSKPTTASPAFPRPAPQSARASRST